MAVGEHPMPIQVVHAVVHFLGLFALVGIFLTLRVIRNPCWVRRPYGHTWHCLMVWGLFGDKSRFYRGTGGSNVL